MKKPNISKPGLVWKQDRRGAWIPYFRVTFSQNGKRKQKLTKLDWQGDPQKLDDEYWSAKSGRHNSQQRQPKHTWKALVIEWRKDPRIQSRLSDGTKRSYRREMDALLEKNAGKDVRNTTRIGMRKVHANLAETPRKADWRLQVVSLLWEYGRKKLDWPLGDNPASGIEKFGTQREYEPWPDWMVQKLPTAPQHVQDAAELILGTGQRPSAAIAMRRDAFLGNTMMVRDEKTTTAFETACPERLTEYIASRPNAGDYIIAKNIRQPVGYNAVEKLFRAWRDSLGDSAKPYVLHGLRKLAIIQLAEAGATDAEIQAVTNQSAETVAYYRRLANRVVLSRNAQRRRTEQERNKGV